MEASGVVPANVDILRGVDGDEDLVTFDGGHHDEDVVGDPEALVDSALELEHVVPSMVQVFFRKACHEREAGGRPTFGRYRLRLSLTSGPSALRCRRFRCFATV